MKSRQMNEHSTHMNFLHSMTTNRFETHLSVTKYFISEQ